MLSKDSLERAETLWCLNVANNTDDRHWWRLENRYGLDGLFLVQLGAQLVDITHDMCHTSLVSNECRQVDWLGGIVLWKGFAFTTMSL